MKWGIIVPIFIYLIATFVVGAYFHRYLKERQGSFQESFFVGDRSLGPVVLVLTMLASSVSAGTFVGAPGLAYEVGFGWVLAVMGQITAGVCMLGILGKKFAIIARKIEAVTMTDLFFARYRSAAVVIGTALGIVIFIGAYMVAQFAGGARIVQSVTGLPYQAGILIFGIVVMGYTAYGGFRAVAVTDAIQGIAMILGGILLWIGFMARTDGLSSVVGQLSTQHPELLTIPGPGNITPTVLFSYFLLFGIAAIGLPHAANRGMTYKDSKTMHQAVMMSAIVMLLFTFFFATLGPAMRVIYPNVGSPDIVLPRFIADTFPGWLAGIVLAAPLSAIMSTVSSMLLVASGAVVKDVYLNYINPDASERAVSTLSYVATLAIGAIVIIISLTPPDYIQFVVVFALGGLQSMFVAPTVFGLFWKRATKWGGIASMYVGLISYLVLEIFFPDLFGDVTNLVPALVLSIVAMVVVSLLTPRPPQEIVRLFWGKSVPSAESEEVTLRR